MPCLNYEMAAMYDKNGNPVGLKDGGKTSVTFSPKEMAKMEGGTLVHNHPPGTNSGCSCSPADAKSIPDARGDEPVWTPTGYADDVYSPRPWG